MAAPKVAVCGGESRRNPGEREAGWTSPQIPGIAGKNDSAGEGI